MPNPSFQKFSEIIKISETIPKPSGSNSDGRFICFNAE